MEEGGGQHFMCQRLAITVDLNSCSFTSGVHGFSCAGACRFSKAKIPMLPNMYLLSIGGLVWVAVCVGRYPGVLTCFILVLESKGQHFWEARRVAS